MHGEFLAAAVVPAVMFGNTIFSAQEKTNRCAYNINRKLRTAPSSVLVYGRKRISDFGFINNTSAQGARSTIMYTRTITLRDSFSI